MWPMHKADYLTTFNDAPTPYYSSSQRLLDYGIAIGWVIPEDYQEQVANRTRLRIDGQLDWMLHARAVGARWLTVRDFMKVVGGDDLAITAHQLKRGVDDGALERKMIDQVINGKPVKRWCYRLRNLWWEPRAS